MKQYADYMGHTPCQEYGRGKCATKYVIMMQAVELLDLSGMYDIISIAEPGFCVDDKL